MAIVSSPSGPVITFGRFSIAPSPGSPTCGWLMIGVPISEPNTPGLVIVNVRVLHFFGLQLLRARAVGEVVERSREPGERQVVGVLDDRDDEPPVERDGDADVDTACGR